MILGSTHGPMLHSPAPKKGNSRWLGIGSLGAGVPKLRWPKVAASDKSFPEAVSQCGGRETEEERRPLLSPRLNVPRTFEKRPRLRREGVRSSRITHRRSAKRSRGPAPTGPSFPSVRRSRLHPPTTELGSSHLKPCDPPTTRKQVRRLFTPTSRGRGTGNTNPPIVPHHAPPAPNGDSLGGPQPTNQSCPGPVPNARSDRPFAWDAVASKGNLPMNVGAELIPPCGENAFIASQGQAVAMATRSSPYLSTREVTLDDSSATSRMLGIVVLGQLRSLAFPHFPSVSLGELCAAWFRMFVSSPLLKLPRLGRGRSVFWESASESGPRLRFVNAPFRIWLLLCHLASRSTYSLCAFRGRIQRLCCDPVAPEFLLYVRWRAV
ncbi:hypothetical protein Cadr_000017104 [Camelus dromedarius]|uniref:Uncharacterized protein n=1 Tax=Camelus dromedarius TaxID=9838 RepID=A0A5N4DHD6_CAMDR|nr:hypothetical protein Cadr_000017104 [Camelus dromedarius]